MGNRSAVSSLIEEQTHGQDVYARMRRRADSRRERVPLAVTELHRATAYEPVRQILQDILRSASGVLGAAQAFFLVSRGGSVLEVACSHGIEPDEVMNAVLLQAAQPIHSALRERILAGGDLQGCVLPLLDGSFEHCAPAVLCVPLDLGPRLSGVMCLLRRQQPQQLSDLDLEIVQALAEQAALAIGAASHSSALSRLQASLNTLVPAYA